VYRALKAMPLELENGGAASRDFIFVDDVVDGLIRCATRGAAGDVYNIASGVETTIRELASAINDLCGGRSRVVVGPRRNWDRSGRRFGSTVKAKHVLDFSARTPIREGLAATVDWMRGNLDWVDRCVHKHDAFMERLGVPLTV
jgi:UDP-glucose 4-epimerase